MAAPKMHGSPGPSPFSPANHCSRGTARRGHDRHRGPYEADAVMVGEGHAPVVAVLLAAARSQTSPSLPQRARIMDPLAVLSLQIRCFWRVRIGGRMCLHGPSSRAACRRSRSRRRDGGEGHAPLWQCFSPFAKGLAVRT